MRKNRLRKNRFQPDKPYILAALIIILTLALPPEVWAQVCAPPGTSTRTQTTINQIQDKTSTVLDRIQKIQLTLFGQSLKETGAASSAALGGMIESSTRARAEDSKKSMVIESENYKNEDAVETLKDTNPTISDCINVSHLGGASTGAVNSRAAQKNRQQESVATQAGIPQEDGNDLPPESSEKPDFAGIVNTARSRAYQTSKLFRDYIMVFCDPQENGGLVPTQDDPLTYVDRNGTEIQYWCGMRSSERKKYWGAPLNMSNLMATGYLSTLREYSGFYPASQMQKHLLIGLPPEAINPASLNSPGAQAAFIDNRAKRAKQILAKSILDDASGRRDPTYASGQTVRGICADEHPPDPNAPYNICEQIPDTVSEMTWLEASVSQFTNTKYLTQTLAGIESTTKMLGELNKIIAYNLMIGQKRMEMAEKRNVLMAALLANGGN